MCKGKKEASIKLKRDPIGVRSVYWYSSLLIFFSDKSANRVHPKCSPLTHVSGTLQFVRNDTRIADGFYIASNFDQCNTL